MPAPEYLCRPERRLRSGTGDCREGVISLPCGATGLMLRGVLCWRKPLCAMLPVAGQAPETPGGQSLFIGMQRDPARNMVLAAVVSACALAAGAQTCTTQARMQPAQREEVAAAAISLATAVQANDSAKIRAATMAQYAQDFSGSEYLIRSTSTAISGDALRVTSVYLLQQNGKESVEFSCPLKDSALETDFTFNSLPTGTYAFAMVEAGGAQPWLLAFLMQRDNGVWKMAGFYPRARTAAGHDGLWFWNEARTAAKAHQQWAAYLLYAQAAEMLRPALFVQSSHLDKLQSEQRDTTPPEITSGVSKDAPLVIKDKAGAEFHFTGLATARSDDGKRVNIALHLPSVAGSDPATTRARINAAAAAFVAAHPEVRKDFQGVKVYAENDAGQPVDLTERDMGQIP